MCMNQLTDLTCVFVKRHKGLFHSFDDCFFQRCEGFQLKKNNPKLTLSILNKKGRFGRTIKFVRNIFQEVKTQN